jgi:hypothetical protein
LQASIGAAQFLGVGDDLKKKSFLVGARAFSGDAAGACAPCLGQGARLTVSMPETNSSAYDVRE